MEVRDVMTKTPMTIDPEAPVETAVAVMRERAMRHLPVVDGDGRLIGIVTDRDLRSAMFGSALAEHLPAGQGGRLRALTAALNDVRVSHVMTWRVVTIGPQAPVAQAAAIMANVRVGSLPVVEGGGWLGSSPSTTCSRRWPRRCHASGAPIPTRISGEFQLMQTGDDPQVRWDVDSSTNGTAKLDGGVSAAPDRDVLRLGPDGRHDRRGAGDARSPATE